MAIVLLMATVMVSSCDDQRVYDSYQHAETDGWEKNEPFVFDLDTLKATGHYSVILCMRISDAYPFRNLQMVVETTVMPTKKVFSDVAICNVTDKQGNMLGHGISLYQYDIPIRKQFFMRGQKIRLKVRHNMKREILPGIVDVGIKVVKD